MIPMKLHVAGERETIEKWQNTEKNVDRVK